MRGSDGMTWRPLVVALPGSECIARAMASQLEGELAEVVVRTFPDGETYVRFDSSPAGRDVVVVATMNRPDRIFLPLLMTLETARDLGARRVVLAAPYLAYMRQDIRFRPGEGITSRYFARNLSMAADGLATVDPHLHRYASLDEIYAIPSRVVHTADAIAAWIRTHVDRPLLLGPDEESGQWVDAVAAAADAPSVVLEKVRRGERDVTISVPQVGQWRDHTPVLIDDIISTARTMIETIAHLRRAQLPAPVCIGVHGVFAGGAYEALLDAGAAQVVTCNTIEHASNGIDVTALLVAGVRDVLGARAAHSTHLGPPALVVPGKR